MPPLNTSPRLLIALCGVTLLPITITLHGCRRGGPVAITTESPQQSYVVEISGNLARPTNFFVTHVVNFSARRSGIPIAAGPLYEADHLDGGFSATYPKHDWPQENVLRFLAVKPKQLAIVDKLTITNRSQNRLAYLKIRYTDLYVVFDVEPRGSVSFLGQRIEPAYLSVEARLDGVNGLLYGGRDVYTDAHESKPVEIEIQVGQGDIRFVGRPTGAGGL